MADGLATFDSDDHLQFCNAQYRAKFPFTGHLRVSGCFYRAPLMAVIETGELLTVPEDIMGRLCDSSPEL